MTTNPFMPSGRLPARFYQGPVLDAKEHRTHLEVFLSHATSDKAHVAVVRQSMEAIGISVYLAEHDPQPGTYLVEKIRDAIHRSQVVVVLVTTTSVNAPYVNQEVGIAEACGKTIIPIVEKGIDTRKLGILQGREYLELDLQSPSETMTKLTAQMRPMVMKQLSVNRHASATPQPANIDWTTSFMLLGLGVLVGVLIAASVSNDEAD